MSRDRRLVAGLDLGSTKTCAVIAEVVGDLPRSPLAKVLGVGLAKNSGVRRGVVRDIEETVRSVTAALRDAERMSGVKAAAVTCGIAGEHVSARNSSGVVAVNGDEITPADVARVNEVARAVSLGPDQELLHDIPQEYMVDQQRGISDPVGMTGMRLEVEAYLVTVQSTAAQNLRKAVQRAGYRVADLVLEPLADFYFAAGRVADAAGPAGPVSLGAARGRVEGRGRGAGPLVGRHLAGSDGQVVAHVVVERIERLAETNHLVRPVRRVRAVRALGLERHHGHARRPNGLDGHHAPARQPLQRLELDLGHVLHCADTPLARNHESISPVFSDSHRQMIRRQELANGCINRQSRPGGHPHR